jgi:hypothetical protein
MLLNGPVYWQYFLQRKIPFLVLLIIFSTTGYSQITTLQKDSFITQRLSPVFKAANKKPFQLRVFYVSPPYKVYTVRKGKELMYWPNFPLTAAQIEQRDRRYEQSLGQQIVGDIAESYLNFILYGKKQTVAVRPRF